MSILGELAVLTNKEGPVNDPWYWVVIGAALFLVLLGLISIGIAIWQSF